MELNMTYSMWIKDKDKIMIIINKLTRRPLQYLWAAKQRDEEAVELIVHEPNATHHIAHHNYGRQRHALVPSESACIKDLNSTRECFSLVALIRSFALYSLPRVSDAPAAVLDEAQDHL